MKRSLAYLAALSGMVGVVVLGAFACGQSTVLSTTVGPEGAAITITEAMSKELAGTELVIPPGALTEKTTITIALGQTVAAGETTALGPSIAIGPEGLTLQQAATLSMPATQVVSSSVGVLQTQGNTTWTIVDGNVIAVTKASLTSPINYPGADAGGGYLLPVATPKGSRVEIQFHLAAELQPVVIAQK